MIDMKVTGVRETILRLRNIGDRVQENARKTMHRAADRIVKRAALYAPVDQHNLEEAIEKRVTYEGKRNRLAIDVGIKPVVNGVNVEQYATIMHEGEYNLGPRSQEKADRTGAAVGPGYLTRAADEEKDKLTPQMIAAVNEEIKG
jgi:hypothetical protein